MAAAMAVLLATAAGVAALVASRPSSAMVLIGEHLMREYTFTPSYDAVYGHGDAYHGARPLPATYSAPPTGYGRGAAPSYDPVYGHGDDYHGTRPQYHVAPPMACKWSVGHHVMVQQGNTYRHAVVAGVLPGCNYQVQLDPHH